MTWHVRDNAQIIHSFQVNSVIGVFYSCIFLFVVLAFRVLHKCDANLRKCVCVHRGPFWQQCWLPEISQVCSLSSGLMQSLHFDVCEGWDLIRIHSGAFKYGLCCFLWWSKQEFSLFGPKKFCCRWQSDFSVEFELLPFFLIITCQKTGSVFMPILVQENWK